MTPGFLAHPTAKSPVTGTLLGFFADIHALSERGTPQHLVALRALRTAYAFLITTTALAAVLWVTGVARRAGTIRSVSVIASVAIGVSVVGITSQLFVGYGFLSFINGIAFLLIVLVGFDFVFGDLLLRPISPVLLALVTCGLAGAWWGVAPLAAGVFLVIISDSRIRAEIRTSVRTRKRVMSVVLTCLGIATLVWTWEMSLGFGIETGHTGSAGTVPIVDTPWILPIMLVAAVLVRPIDGRLGRGSRRTRAPLVLLVVYVVGVWGISWLKYAEPRYAAFKILALLSIVCLVGLGVLLVENARRLGGHAVLVGLGFVVFWSGAVHESYNGIRGPGLGTTTTSVQAKVLDVLEKHPGKKIVCLHQNEEKKIDAYLCSRLAGAFAPGMSPLLDAWLSALLNSDISPNGLPMPQEQHVGARVLREFGRDTSSPRLVVILIDGDAVRGPTTELGPDFWWVGDLEWSEFEIEYL